MNISLELTSITILFTFIFLILFSFKRKTNQPPEPPGAWPIIGHLHQLLSGDQLFHRKLSEMAEKCGPLMTVCLGRRRAFVASTWEVAKECFTVNDLALSSRPETSCAMIMCYNNSNFGFAPYGPLWRDLRKLTKLGLLSSARIELLGPVFESEVDTGIKELYDMWEKNSSPKPLLVDLHQWFKHLTLNIIVKVLTGKRYSKVDDEEERKLSNGVAEFFRLYGVSVVADELPGFLRWLDVLGLDRAMKSAAKEMDEVIEGWVFEHRKRRNENKIRENEEEDFIDLMLLMEEKGQLSSHGIESNTLIKATCQEMVFGGNDTLTCTLTWAISLLLNNNRVLSKAQQEIDDLHIESRLVNKSDIKNLPYLQAIIKETFRLYPAAPLLAPREAIENCIVYGYTIPLGSLLFLNAFKIQRDPKIWENPDEFIPERFLERHADVDPRRHCSELMVFSGGRRMCPGSLFAVQVLHLTLARFIHAFDMKNSLDQDVDLSEGPGLTITKASPLKVLLTPRLASKLYSS